MSGADDGVKTPPWAHHLPAGVDPTTINPLARRSLSRAWRAVWEAAPDRPAFRDQGGQWRTGGDLLAATEQTAGRFARAGLGQGDRVLLSGRASTEFVVAHWAALRLGLVVVPVNPALTAREVGALVDHARPRAAVVDDAGLKAAVTRLAPALPVTGLEVDWPDGPVPALDRAEAHDLALLPFTSGTTGAPKGAPLTHGNLLASAEAVLLAWRWTARDRLILCLPLFHMHGLGVGLHGTLLAGASAILQPGFASEDVLGATAEATLFFGVPTMYARLVQAEGADRLGRLRLCVSGSAPLSPELHQAVADRCGQAVLERYGMTETAMLVSNPIDGDRRPGTVGFPLPAVEVRLAPGTDEIEVRGPNVFGGYLAPGDGDAAAFTADGWFRTGDIGAFDDAGYLSIVGRAKDLIISGGYNVYPREVEDVLRSHPAVVDAAVAGTPSAEWGEIVTAFVEAGPDLDEHELLEWSAARLAPYKRPRIVHRLGALPRNPLGKVVRSELRPDPLGATPPAHGDHHGGS